MSNIYSWFLQGLRCGKTARGGNQYNVPIASERAWGKKQLLVSKEFRSIIKLLLVIA